MFQLKQVYALNVTDDYNSFMNCTINENEDNNIFFKHLLLSIPSSILLLGLFSLIMWTILKPLLLNKKWMNS